MDDSTWRRRVDRRRRRKRQEPWLLILLGTLLVGVAIWYFFIFIRTPEYALNEIQESIKTHDVKTFEERVDLKTLTANAYDDLTVDYFADNQELSPKTRTMFEKFLVTIKPLMTDAISDTMTDYVSSGSWSLPKGEHPLKSRALGIDYDRFLERSLLRSISVQGLGSIVREDNRATAELHIVDSYTQTPFTLQLAMEQGDSGWRVVSILNYRSYLEQVQPLHAKDLAAYITATQPIVQASNQKFSQLQSDFRKLSRTDTNGALPEAQRKKLKALVLSEIIPALEKRDAQLAVLQVPPGAAYLATQRQESTKVTVAAWKIFAEALDTDDLTKYGKAESMHKRELDIDLRIEEIVKHTTLLDNTQDMPSIVTTGSN